MATLWNTKTSGKRDENGKTILEKSEEVINVATIQGRFSSPTSKLLVQAARPKHKTFLCY